MRKIEFRAKNTKNEWVYGDYAELATQGDYLTPSIIDAGFVHAVNPESLGQFTGLTDKNGKEIYDGDIVQCGGSKYIVHFSEDRAGWFPFATDDGCGCCSYDLCNNLNSYVIGNIHENKDLLND